MPQTRRPTCAPLASFVLLLLAACATPATQPPPPPKPAPAPAAIEEYSIGKHPICFNSGTAKIDQAFDHDLIDMAVWLKQHAKVTITIEGHTDERGTREYNLALGQARAEAVRRDLAKLGIPRKRMKAVGYGMERPLVAGYSDEARRENRCAVAVIDAASGR
jgi:peptidoglycan-associated lipoprotein